MLELGNKLRVGSQFKTAHLLPGINFRVYMPRLRELLILAEDLKKAVVKQKYIPKGIEIVRFKDYRSNVTLVELLTSLSKHTNLK